MIALGISSCDMVKYHPFVVNADPICFGVSKKSVDPLILGRLREA